jgi:Cu/Ag efflux protein CusF
MFKPLAPVLICLLAVSAAHAQSGGRHGHGGAPGGRAPSTARPTAPDPAKPAQAPKAPNKVEIIGVIQAIDREHDRVTIAYEPVEDLNWPAGAHPFPVEKTALLDGATVGEKIRFSVDSGQISALKPF